MPAPTHRRVELSPEHELDRQLDLPQAAEIKAISVDTLKRRYASKIHRASERRLTMKLRDALYADPDD
jgi:hypothetical protein